MPEILLPIPTKGTTMNALSPPTRTASGAPIPDCFLLSNPVGMAPLWQAQPPSLHHLMALRTPEFNWVEDAARWYVLALHERSGSRRIKDDHKGLTLEAARDVIAAAYAALSKECSAVNVWLLGLPNNDDMAREIERLFAADPNVKAFANHVIRGYQSYYFTNDILTQSNPLIATGSINLLDEDRYKIESLVDEVDRNRVAPLKQINRALDVINLYRKPSERQPYIQIETLLTTARRVIYAIFDRA